MPEFLLPSSPWKEGTTPSPLRASPSWRTWAAAVPRRCAWLCPRPHLQHWHRCPRWPAAAPSPRGPGWQPGAAVSGYGCSWGWHRSDPWREELHQSELLPLSLAEEECCSCGDGGGPRSQVHLRQDRDLQESSMIQPSVSRPYGPHTQISRKWGLEAKCPTDTQVTFSWWWLGYDNLSLTSLMRISATSLWLLRAARCRAVKPSSFLESTSCRALARIFLMALECWRLAEMEGLLYQERKQCRGNRPASSAQQLQILKF